MTTSPGIQIPPRVNKYTTMKHHVNPNTAVVCNTDNGFRTMTARACAMALNKLHNQVLDIPKPCGYKSEKKINGPDLHIEWETTTLCGEDIDTFTDDYKYWSYCPHCGGKRDNSE